MPNAITAVVYYNPHSILVSFLINIEVLAVHKFWLSCFQFTMQKAMLHS